MATDARPRRRKWQFTIRTLLLLMVPLALVFGWIGVQVQRARARVEFERQFHGRPSFVWKHGEVTEILFNGSGRESTLNDTEISRLSGLPRITLLYIAHAPQITNASMVIIGELRSLKALFLHDTGITDAGLAHLKQLTALHKLNLRGKNITDVGLLHLRALPNLQTLWLWDTNVTDAGIASLSEFPNLQYIGLAHNADVTEKGVERCRERMPNVEIDYSPFVDEETIRRSTPR